MKKIKIKNFLILFIIIIGLIFFVYFVNKKDDKLINKPEEEEILKKDFKNMNLIEVEEYAKKHKLEITKTYEFNDDIEKDVVISSSLNNKNLDLVISKGSIPLATYKEKNVNELGKVPIMMYHGIREKTSNSSGTIGGNVDKDGYNRTPEAFEADLEFYYQNGYRMVSLADYVKGIVDVPLGFSPLILTFDDGNADNFKVIGKNEDGSLKFDSKSAIGILEKMKEKYPDFNVTATFFLNAGLCNQPEYNEDIMKWLIKNNYDIGNHTTNHADFTKITVLKTQEVVGKLYQMLDQIIPNQYVKIIALPFGSPYKKTHTNYNYILKGEYEGYSYETESALRVGWEPEVSPFAKTFDKTFLKRCRAYDNNGKEFDIKMVFNMLKTSRYISDGEKDLITIPSSLKDNLGETDKKIITY